MRVSKYIIRYNFDIEQAHFELKARKNKLFESEQEINSWDIIHPMVQHHKQTILSWLGLIRSFSIDIVSSFKHSKYTYLAFFSKITILNPSVILSVAIQK